MPEKIVIDRKKILALLEKQGMTAFQQCYPQTQLAPNEIWPNMVVVSIINKTVPPTLISMTVFIDPNTELPLGKDGPTELAKMVMESLGAAMAPNLKVNLSSEELGISPSESIPSIAWSVSNPQTPQCASLLSSAISEFLVKSGAVSSFDELWPKLDGLPN